jgi:hypothetical protein
MAGRLLVALLAPIGIAAAVPADQGAVAGAAGARFSITTNPPLAPSFSPSIHDYAVRCAGDATTSLTTSGSGSVTVGGQAMSQPASLTLALVADQSVQVASKSGSYSIRCLPSDFPSYSAVVSGSPRATGYLVTIGTYVVAFDTDGVPVWWFDQPGAVASYIGLNPIDAKFLTPTSIAWHDGSAEYEVRGLDGSLRSVVGGGSIPLDVHDLQLLPNGNYLGIQYVHRDCPAVPSQCVDLSSWGASAQAPIIDGVIVEVTPSHQVVWSWSVADHLDVAAENVNWRDQNPDVIHMNSVVSDGKGGVIFSARHLDAVYRVDMATGAITWKLGGTATPESLTWLDPKGIGPTGFSGQHFARLLPDGDVTVQDNGSRDGRPVRAVEFDVNVKRKTATVVKAVTDARLAYGALCCGSASRLPGGHWLVNWGYADYVSELTPAGAPVLTIAWPGASSYRAETLDASVAVLRAGMNAQIAPVALAGTGAPDAPSAVRVVSTGPTTAEVDVDPPADNGSAITDYTVTVSDAYDPNDPSNGTQISAADGSIAISGLNPADTYWVTVAATNALGTGAGASSTLFTPGT